MLDSGPFTAGRTRPLGATGCSGGTSNVLSYYRAHLNTNILIAGVCLVIKRVEQHASLHSVQPL